MITFPLRENDLDELKKIHEKYYKEEFSFPDFSKNFLCSFKICTDTGRIITAGGVKLFPEMVLITDKDLHINPRAFGLMSALQIASLCSFNAGHELLYASAQDKKWQDQLIDVGFRESKNHNFVIG